MTLPDICPLDGSQTCKGRECHLFCLEWRTRDPTCLIGYSTTSKIKSGKDNRNQDTYAEETFRKLGRQPAAKKRTSTEKGDWVPSWHTEEPPKKIVRKEEKYTPYPDLKGPNPQFARNTDFQEKPPRPQTPDPESNNDFRLREKLGTKEADEAAFRAEARIKREEKREAVDENPVIFAKVRPAPEKQKTPEKVISKDRNATIFASYGSNESKNFQFADKEENKKKPDEDSEKRKKLSQIMEIDAPDVYDKEFWS
jgi:hypothetical protein